MSVREPVRTAVRNEFESAVCALEDKIVQRATAAVLNAIYEEDFLGFSYGFRPKRSQHDALDALVVGITTTKVNWTRQGVQVNGHQGLGSGGGIQDPKRRVFVGV